MARLDEVIARARIGESRLVEETVFGTSDLGQISDATLEFCVEHLGTPVREPLFYAASVGCVIGVELDDGRKVVVKAYQPRWRAGFLRAVADAQRSLERTGFPCPKPIAGPVRLLSAHALIESHVPDPGQGAPNAAMLAVSARGLAGQIERCRGLVLDGLSPHPMDGEHDGLYPTPHSPVFDFEATATGAEWIDELARVAKEGRDRHGGPLVVAHCDWSLRNVRVTEHALLAVYDWDSLSRTREVVAVGQAAATWSAIDGSQISPDIREVAAFVSNYEAARGGPFSRDERAAIGASALYVLAYTARCEHALDPASVVHHRARPRLASDGDLLLSLPEIMASD